jgi:hypothetical protein
MHIDQDEVNLQSWPVACIYERRSTSVAGLHTVRINPSHAASLRLQVDGMSGAPIFSIDGHLGSYVVNFRGTILRGDNGRPHYMDDILICRMFEKLRSP